MDAIAKMPTGTRRSPRVRYAYQLYTVGDHTTNLQPVKDFDKLAKITGAHADTIRRASVQDEWDRHASLNVITAHQDLGSSLPAFTTEREELSKMLTEAQKHASRASYGSKEYKDALSAVERLAKLSGLSARIDLEAKVELKQRELAANLAAEEAKKKNDLDNDSRTITV